MTDKTKKQPHEIMDDFLSCYFRDWGHRQQRSDHVLALYYLNRDPPDVETARRLLEEARLIRNAYRVETGSLRQVDCIGLVVSGIFHNWQYLKHRMEIMELLREVDYDTLDRWVVMISTPLRVLLRFAIEYALFNSRKQTTVKIGRVNDALVISWVADRGCIFSRRLREEELSVDKDLHAPDPEEFEEWLRLSAEVVALRIIVLACDILDIDRPRRRYVQKADQLVVEMHITLSS